MTTHKVKLDSKSIKIKMLQDDVTTKELANKINMSYVITCKAVKGQDVSIGTAFNVCNALGLNLYDYIIVS